MTKSKCNRRFKELVTDAVHSHPSWSQAPSSLPVPRHPALLRGSAVALELLPTNWGEICKQVIREVGYRDRWSVRSLGPLQGLLLGHSLEGRAMTQAWG